MSDPRAKLAEACRKLLAGHEQMTPEKWEQLSPIERRMFADVFTKENIEVMRELAKGLKA